MKSEISWKIAAPIVALIVIGVGYFMYSAFSEKTVSAADIKAPPPPGGRAPVNPGQRPAIPGPGDQ